MAIVTTHYRYKRPPRKRQAAALEVPAIVAIPDKTRRKVLIRINTSAEATTAPPANADRKSAIVTVRRKAARSLPPGLLPETPEEIQRRGDAADALWRELVRRVAERSPEVTDPSAVSPSKSRRNR